MPSQSWVVRALAVALLAGLAAGAPPDVTLCFLVRTSREARAYHFLSAVSYLQPRYPNVRFSGRVVGQYPSTGLRQTTSSRDLGLSLVGNGSDCDAVIGPGASSLALGVNALVSTLWVDMAATATELSDVNRYPLFSRVTPHDGATSGGVAAWMHRNGWLSAPVHTLCMDETYGRSVASGFEVNVRSYGGSIGKQLCIATTATTVDVRQVLETLIKESERSGASRAVFMGMSTNTPGFDAVIDVALELEAHTKLAIFFSESACSSGNDRWLELPGSLCAKLSIDAVAREAFMRHYAARDVAAQEQALTALSWPADVAASGRNISATFEAYTVDATHWVMAAISQYTDSGLLPTPATHFRTGADAPTALEFVQWARLNVIVDGGLSGNVELNAAGDRDAADMELLNAQPTGTTEPGTTVVLARSVAWIDSNGTVVQVGDAEAANSSDPATRAAAARPAGERWYVFGGYSETVPSGTAAAGFQAPIWVIVLAFSVCALLIAVGCVCFRLARMKADAIQRLISSQLPKNVLKGALELFDVGTDAGAAYVVFSSDQSSPGVAYAYVALLCIAVLAAIRTFYLRVLTVQESLKEDDDFDVNALARSQETMQRSEMLNLVVEDIPLTIVAVYSMTTEFSLVVLLSACVSCFSAGIATMTLPVILEKLLFSKQDAEEEQAAMELELLAFMAEQGDADDGATTNNVSVGSASAVAKGAEAANDMPGLGVLANSKDMDASVVGGSGEFDPFAESEQWRRASSDSAARQEVLNRFARVRKQLPTIGLSAASTPAEIDRAAAFLKEHYPQRSVALHSLAKERLYELNHEHHVSQIEFFAVIWPFLSAAFGNSAKAAPAMRAFPKLSVSADAADDAPSTTSVESGSWSSHVAAVTQARNVQQRSLYGTFRRRSGPAKPPQRRATAAPTDMNLDVSVLSMGTPEPQHVTVASGDSPLAPAFPPLHAEPTT